MLVRVGLAFPCKTKPCLSAKFNFEEILFEEAYGVSYRSPVHPVVKALRDDVPAMSRVPSHGEQLPRSTSSSRAGPRKTAVYPLERRVRPAFGIHTLQI